MQFKDQFLVIFIAPQPGFDIVQDSFLGNLFHLDGAAFGNMGKSVFDFFFDGSGASAEQRLEPGCKIILFIGLGHKVQDGQAVLPFAKAQPAAELLQENGQAVRGPQEKDGIDGRDIDTLIEKIHCEKKIDLSCFQGCPGGSPFLFRSFARQRKGRDAMCVGIICHEARMGFGNTETEPPDCVDIRRVAVQSIQDGMGPFQGRTAFQCKKPVQFTRIILAVRPFDMGEVERVFHAEIMERAEQTALDGIGQTDLGGNVPVKIRQDILSIHPLRRRREAQQDPGLEPGEQVLV